jgi:hypothetical protein
MAQITPPLCITMTDNKTKPHDASDLYMTFFSLFSTTVFMAMGKLKISIKDTYRGGRYIYMVLEQKKVRPFIFSSNHSITGRNFQSFSDKKRGNSTVLRCTLSSNREELCFC